MHGTPIPIGNLRLGGNAPLVLFAGPCVIESETATITLAEKLSLMARRTGVGLVFKASYDKANRTAIGSFRGPGLQEGLRILDRVRTEVGVPVISDVHRFEEIAPASDVLDVLQVPAFLCRQTDFVCDVARTGKPVNVKKGQFMAPQDMHAVIEKITSTGNDRVMITERGATFGYNNLVADMRSLVLLRELGAAVVFDATHSVQLPGGRGTCSGGQRQFVAPLARAAVAVGVDALFLEVHEDPDRALCDGPNSLPLAMLEGLLDQVLYIRQWDQSGTGSA